MLKTITITFILFISIFSSINHLFSENRPRHIRIPRNLDKYNFPNLPKYNPHHNDAAQPLRVDFTITLRDGVIIDAVKFIPRGAVPVGGWPTVIMVHGYGNEKETIAKFCFDQAVFGYYTMTFSVRGQGHSGGLSNLISRTEAMDFIEIVNWVKADSVNGANPNNILVMGGSQGGLLPFMAASLGQTSIGKLNVKTIISALAPPDFASSWIENGSIKMTLLWSVSYHPDTVKYNSLTGRIADWIYTNNKEKWDSIAYWLPIDRDFMNLVPNNTTPLIVEGSWQDKFFNASGISQSTTLLNAPFRMYLGAVQGHGSDQSPSEDQWHMNFYNDWYYYWLFGVENGVLNAPKYQYGSTMYPVANKYWAFKHDSSTVWLPPNNTNQRLYFGQNGQLRDNPNQNGNAKATLNNTVTGGLTMEDAVNYEFKGSGFTSKFTKQTVNFTSSVLTADKKMVGVPKVNLQYSSNAGPFCQFNFQIFEVKPDGSQRLVNRINYTDRNYTTANAVKTVNINGQAHSHIFKAGNKIRVTVTNLDTSPEDSVLLESNPFVLPVLINNKNIINLNSSSYIDIPVVNTSQDISGNTNSTNSALEFKLSQNYPNPFNPVTLIEYSIPVQGKVELKIYDILGKEVKTLVNEFKEAGTHNVMFNASELASGVYFYKIISGSFRDVKRMVLVK
ncbi:MAG: T9SS C-terminal target domain-containing protein [Ignavibacteriae bacterium]|nr:MAG: T9SS C-terminal target domain-containing protein [Ignavibacteriota bacterium]